MLRQRPTKPANSLPSEPAPLAASSSTTAMDRERDHDPSRPLLASDLSGSSPPYSFTLVGQDVADESAKDMYFAKKSRKSQWIFLAVASGACAAFNGVFAKLAAAVRNGLKGYRSDDKLPGVQIELLTDGVNRTTTKLTTSFATSIANLLGLAEGEKIVEYIIRAMFFSLNLIFNGVMWALFTKALARGTSTTQVSIINTSSNFMITAILGFFIFTESLPPLWWLGAAMLVAGNVIIGRREEKDDTPDEQAVAENGEGTYTEEDEVLLAESQELDGDIETSAVKRRLEEDDALILDLEGDKSEDELV